MSKAMLTGVGVLLAGVIIGYRVGSMDVREWVIEAVEGGWKLYVDEDGKLMRSKQGRSLGLV